MPTFLLSVTERKDIPASTSLVETNDNQNPIIQVITWLFLALFTLALVFRCLSTFYLKTNRLLRWDNILILLAYVYSPVITWEATLTFIHRLPRWGNRPL